jgi:hypothetical protein
MGGYTNKRPSGYLECDYTNPWPGLVTNVASSQAPPGAFQSCQAQVVRGRLTPQPSIFNITSTGGTPVTAPVLAPGENICAWGDLQAPGSQQGSTVVITNLSVYIDYINPATLQQQKIFNKIFTFPTAYPRYARFGACVIGNTLYFSSSSQLGVYALRPTFTVASVEIINPGGYFTSPPTVVFSDGGGSGATGTANLTGGNLSSVTLGNGGTYISPPIVNLNGGATYPLSITGSLAIAIGILATNPNGYVVQEITANTGVANFNPVNTGGSNYSAPTVAFIGGGGTGASATAVLSPTGNGAIIALVMVSFGQNYTSPPTAQIIDPTGTGAVVPNLSLFNGKPFIGADFMESIDNRLVLGNIIGGDGNSTTSLGFPIIGFAGAGYSGFPGADIVGGDGSIYVTTNASSQIGSANVGQLNTFTGTITSGQNTITGVSSLTGIQIGMQLSDLGVGITGTTKITGFTYNANLNLSGSFTNGSTSITGVPSIAGIVAGQPLVGVQVPPGAIVISASGSTVVMSQGALGTQTSAAFQAIVGNTITMSANASASITESIAAFGFITGNQGNGYYAEPYANVTGNNTAQAQIYIALSGQVAQNSSQTRYPGRLQWSAPNAYGYFDPNWLTAPGGQNDLAEARGVISGLTVIEGVLFVGHNGGETETTPAAGGGSSVPFAFYPLWASDQGVLVRYGSMAQYGTTCCFLSNNSAYMLNPNGLTEIGQNIANQLENFSLWNNGNFPLQGLYGSIVVIEGQMHYLAAFSSDDWDYQNGNTTRGTTVFDFNINENSWHTWIYPGYTLTAPIYQSFDTAVYSASITANDLRISRDSWLLTAFTVASGSGAPYTEQANAYEAAPFTRAVQLASLSVAPVVSPVLSAQFRTETPSIARMQSERRVLVEYENQPSLASLSPQPSLVLSYTGQQDPTAQTGTVIQNQTSTVVLTQAASSLANQILTQQADFGTFTGAGTSLKVAGALGVGANLQALVSLVRITQIADIPKTQVP